MKYDVFGQAYTTEEELCNLLYKNPNVDMSLFYVEDPTRYNESVKATYSGFPLLQQYGQSVEILALMLVYEDPQLAIDTYDRNKQSHWFMPDEYVKLDIAQWLLDQCKTDPELQRVGEELLLYQERDLFNLLRYLKYFVDTMRSNNIVWGLGRGSSVASYVLYLIGVHKINSLYYDLPIEEFLK